MNIYEKLLEAGEFAAAGLYEEPERGLFYRKALALRRYFEHADLPEYRGGRLYPSGSQHFSMCVSPDYQYGIRIRNRERLEELVPYGSQETAAPADDFVLRVIRGSTSELYKPCRWSSVSRSFTAEGLRLICKGIALTGKEVSA